MVALFCCGGYGLGPLIPFRGSITAISARLFWLIIFILLWNTSILIRLIIHESSLNGLMSHKIMSIIWYVLHSDQISTNTTPMGDFWLMDYILEVHLLLCSSPSTLPDTCSTCRYIEAVGVAWHLTKALCLFVLYYVLLFNLSPMSTRSIM